MGGFSGHNFVHENSFVIVESFFEDYTKETG